MLDSERFRRFGCLLDREVPTLKAVYREVKLSIKHGPRYPFQRYLAPSGILKARPIRTAKSGDFTVCVLTSRHDWLASLWALVSFYEFTAINAPLLIYSDGSLSPAHKRGIQHVFPDARIVEPESIDSHVSRTLSAFPNCLRFRSTQPCARRIVDLPVICGSDFILMLDSDIFFLNGPTELQHHLRSLRSGQFVFERDIQDAYFAPRAFIQENFGVAVTEQVNCGIMIADVSSFDYARVEVWLRKSGVASHPWAEQTLWAMYAGRDRTTLLGDEYDVTMSPRIDSGTIVKHYIKPIRDFMYAEGISYLNSLLLERGAFQCS